MRHGVAIALFFVTSFRPPAIARSTAASMRAAFGSTALLNTMLAGK
jgi:hypothetical protein